MSTTLSNNTFGTAMAGNDTVGAHARRHAARRAASTARQPQWSRIMKMLVSGAIGLGVWVGVAAPASADANSVGADPNKVGALSCSCQEAASPGGPALTEEMKRGIRAGLSAGLGKPQP
jgi:hypothetical protein